VSLITSDVKWLIFFPEKGRDALPKIVKETLKDYNELTKEEKEVITREFEEYKSSKAKGARTSARSRVNDVTYTINMVENEVCSHIILLYQNLMVSMVI
jgi:hypothetical protein